MTQLDQNCLRLLQGLPEAQQMITTLTKRVELLEKLTRKLLESGYRDWRRGSRCPIEQYFWDVEAAGAVAKVLGMWDGKQPAPWWTVETPVVDGC